MLRHVKIIKVSHNFGVPTAITSAPKETVGPLKCWDIAVFLPTTPHPETLNEYGPSQKPHLSCKTVFLNRRATRGSPGICHFSFLSIFHE
jgi:hypothetical protein